MSERVITSGDQTSSPFGANHETELYEGQEAWVHPSSRVLERGEVAERFDLVGIGVCSLNLGGKDFFIIDTRAEDRADYDFLIVDEDCGKKDGPPGYKAVQLNETVVLGRRHHKDRFAYPPTASRRHVAVAYTSQGLSIKNLAHTNRPVVHGLLVSGPLGSAGEGNDVRTMRVVSRMVEKSEFDEADATAPYGHYRGYPILGRESPRIDGGISLGASPREAIIADGSSEIIQAAYEDFLRKVGLVAKGKEGATFTEKGIVTAVKDYVRTAMEADEAAVDDLSWAYEGDQPVTLSTYLIAGVGVCRHHSLLAGLFIENLIKDGFLRGSVRLERNEIPELGGAHAWPLFVGGGEPLVVDATLNYVGTKTDAHRKGRWHYELSSEEPRISVYRSRGSAGLNGLRKYLVSLRQGR